MTIREPEQLRVWQTANRFKLEVYRLMHSSPSASRDFRYRDQVFDAASSIESDLAEGFRRHKAAVICQFITYALSSLEEAITRVRDGIARGYFTAREAQVSLQLGDDCKRYAKNWRGSLGKYIERTKRPRGQSPDRRRARNKDSPDL